MTQLTRLRSLDFDNNKLTGELPTGLSSLIRLRSICLDRNKLRGACRNAHGSED